MPSLGFGGLVGRSGVSDFKVKVCSRVAGCVRC